MGEKRSVCRLCGSHGRPQRQVVPVRPSSAVRRSAEACVRPARELGRSVASCITQRQTAPMEGTLSGFLQPRRQSSCLCSAAWGTFAPRYVGNCGFWERLERRAGCAAHRCSLFVLSSEAREPGNEYGHTLRGHCYLGGMADTAKNKRALGLKRS